MWKSLQSTKLQFKSKTCFRQFNLCWQPWSIKWSIESTHCFCAVPSTNRTCTVGIHMWLAVQTLPMSARRQKGSPRVPTLWGESDARLTAGIGVGLDVGLQLTWHCLKFIFRLRLRQPPTAAIATRRCQLLWQLQHLSASVSAFAPVSVLENAWGSSLTAYLIS